MRKAYIFILFGGLLVSCTSMESQELIAIDSPASEGSAEPNLILGANGILYLTWVEQQEDLALLNYSSWEGSQWSSPESIAKGRDWFVNWADYPAMAVNKQGDLIAHYLQMSDTGSYTYDIKVVGKKSTATSWSTPIKLHRDSVKAEHGFVSMLPMDDGQFFLTWLDGRNTMPMEEHDGHGSGGAMTIRSATLSPDLELSEEIELDSRVCDCCQTTAAITQDGPVVFYRDRSEEEVRDIYKVRKVNDSWTAPEAIYDDHWVIEGCPVNGPKSTVINDHLAVVWFTAAEGQGKVNFAFSNDSGAHFGNPTPLNQEDAIGRVDIEPIDSTTFFVSWMEGSAIKAAIVNSAGEVLKRYELATSSDGRNSGFPQIAVLENQVMIAWTDAEANRVKTKMLTP